MNIHIDVNARRRQLLARMLAALALVTAGLVVTTSEARAEAATFEINATWDTGYTAEYVVRNDTDAPLEHWRLMFFLPRDTTISSAWNGSVAQHGVRWVIQNAAWNAVVAPGHEIRVGMQVRGGGRPANCTVNGAPCSGGPARGDITPPTEVSDLRVVDGVLRWSPSTDDVGVHRYEVEIFGGEERPRPRFILPGDLDTEGEGFDLAAADLSSAFAIGVRARDAAFNYSQYRTVPPPRS